MYVVYKFSVKISNLTLINTLTLPLTLPLTITLTLTLPLPLTLPLYHVNSPLSRALRPYVYPSRSSQN